MDISRGTKRGALTLVSQHCPHLVDHWKPCPSQYPCVECCGWLVLPLLLGSGVFLREELGFHHITSPALMAGLCPCSSSPSTLHQMLCESGSTKGKNQTHTHPRRKRMEQITTEITTGFSTEPSLQKLRLFCSPAFLFLENFQQFHRAFQGK